MRRRGQSALEFLTTYGWAILIVAGSILVMAYASLAAPGLLQPERCAFPAGSGLSCTAAEATTDGTLSARIENRAGDLVIEEARCSGQANGRVTTPGNVEGHAVQGEPWPDGSNLLLSCRFDGDNPFAGHGGERREAGIELALRHGGQRFERSASLLVEVAR